MQTQRIIKLQYIQTTNFWIILSIIMFVTGTLVMVVQILVAETR